MSWRVRITDDPFLYPELSWADWIIYAPEEVDAVAEQAHWMRPLKVYGTSIEDPRLIRLVQLWHEEMWEIGVWVGHEGAFQEVDDETLQRISGKQWESLTEAEVYAVPRGVSLRGGVAA